jgi:hypothetical protein
MMTTSYAAVSPPGRWGEMQGVRGSLEGWRAGVDHPRIVPGLLGA